MADVSDGLEPVVVPSLILGNRVQSIEDVLHVPGGRAGITSESIITAIELAEGASTTTTITKFSSARQ